MATASATPSVNLWFAAARSRDGEESEASGKSRRLSGLVRRRSIDTMERRRSQDMIGSGTSLSMDYTTLALSTSSHISSSRVTMPEDDRTCVTSRALSESTHPTSSRRYSWMFPMTLWPPTTRQGQGSIPPPGRPSLTSRSSMESHKSKGSVPRRRFSWLFMSSTDKSSSTHGRASRTSYGSSSSSAGVVGMPRPPRTSKASLQSSVKSWIVSSIDTKSASMLPWFSSDRTYWEDKRRRATSCRKILLRENTVKRRVYELTLALFLGYTGTVFPFRLCFLEFQIPEPAKDHVAWTIIETIVDIFFVADLFLNFVVTYIDHNGREVTDHWKILMNYMKGYFWVNLVSCIPPSLVRLILEKLVQSQDPSATRAVGITRFQRISRLARLARLLRLVKVVPLLLRSATVRRLRSTRFVRISNFLLYLVWAVHLLACGWVLTAYLDQEFTGSNWLERRQLENGRSLLDEGPLVRWIHCMYFVLVVFTTVGFGDIWAVSVLEISYASFTMLTGTILNSIIMSEMMNIIMSMDQTVVNVQHQRNLVKGFAEQSDLDENMHVFLMRCVEAAHSVQPKFSTDNVGLLLSGRVLPISVMVELPKFVYHGRLMRNRFLTGLKVLRTPVPPQLPLQIALTAVKKGYKAKEIVYRVWEHPHSIFLVLDGVFACVATPSAHGGQHDTLPVISDAMAEFTRTAMIKAGRQRPSDVSSADLKPSVSSRLRRVARGGGSKTSSNPLGGSLPLSASPTGQVEDDGRFPYTLKCPGSYFGEFELIFPGQRRCNVRCESRLGMLLLLHKHDFLRMMADFPQYVMLWKVTSLAREERRFNDFKCLKRPVSYKHLAACIIQRRVRSWLRRGRRRLRKGLLPMIIREESASVSAVSAVSAPGSAAPKAAEPEPSTAAKADLKEAAEVTAPDDATPVPNVPSAIGAEPPQTSLGRGPSGLQNGAQADDERPPLRSGNSVASLGTSAKNPPSRGTSVASSVRVEDLLLTEASMLLAKQAELKDEMSSIIEGLSKLKVALMAKLTDVKLPQFSAV